MNANVPESSKVPVDQTNFKRAGRIWQDSRARLIKETCAARLMSGEWMRGRLVGLEELAGCGQPHSAKRARMRAFRGEGTRSVEYREYCYSSVDREEHEPPPIRNLPTHVSPTFSIQFPVQPPPTGFAEAKRTRGPESSPRKLRAFLIGARFSCSRVASTRAVAKIASQCSARTDVRRKGRRKADFRDGRIIVISETQTLPRDLT